jgi:hypothetical protein
MKTTPQQMAGLGLLSMSLDLPTGYHGYLDMFISKNQPPAVAAEWLARLETVAPEITQKYWAIIAEGL